MRSILWASLTFVLTGLAAAFAPYFMHRRFVLAIDEIASSRGPHKVITIAFHNTMPSYIVVAIMSYPGGLTSG